MIKLSDIGYRYSESARPVLSDVSLQIEPGESVCVMGANGSGKSTLAKLMAGLLETQRGQIRLDGASRQSPRVGIIFQNPDNQMVAVTVEKEVAFALENLGCSQGYMEHNVHETLNRFHISDLAQRITSELSGGEKQRVALASVMVFRPDVLILDEPDSFLDQRGREALWEELQHIRTEKPEMVQIHITQYPHVARRYDRMVVLHEGRLVADGPPERIFGDQSFCAAVGLANGIGAHSVPQSLTRSLSSRYRSAEPISTIELSGVSFGYRSDAPVLTDLDLRLRRGETTGVVGHSGSGKSTLAALFCSLLTPTAGSVRYLDASGSDIERTTVRGRVAAVFQQPERQFFLSTCTEEVAFGPENLGQVLSPQTITDMLSLVGLAAEEFASRDPFSLSGGEKRRLAFASIISMLPDFVIFDEPTCGLDQEGVGRFGRLAAELKDLGLGIAVISHDGLLLKHICDRVLLLKKGHDCLEFPAEEFFAHPELSSVVSPVEDGLTGS